MALTYLDIKAELAAFKEEYPLDDGTTVVDNSPDTIALADTYRAMMELEKEAVANKELAKLALQKRMGYAGTLCAGPYKVTFKAVEKGEYVVKANITRVIRVNKTSSKSVILPE